MALTPTRLERLFYASSSQPQSVKNSASELSSKTPINIVIENDKSSGNDDVASLGRARSYVSRLKATMEYETPMTGVLLNDVLAANGFSGLISGVTGGTAGTETVNNVLLSTFGVPTVAGSLTHYAGKLGISDDDGIDYLYSNDAHSVVIYDSHSNYKIMAEPGSAGSVVRVSCSAVGNVIANPYESRTIPSSLGTRIGGFFPTSEVTASLVMATGAATGTHNELTRISNLSVDLGAEIAHMPTLSKGTNATGYEVPEFTRFMPMVEITRYYSSDDSALNTMLNTLSKTNPVDTRIGLVVRFRGADANDNVWVIIPKVNLLEPTYSDDSDVKTQTLMFEQQRGTSVPSGTSGVFEPASIIVSTNFVPPQGASGDSDETDDEEGAGA